MTTSAMVEHIEKEKKSRWPYMIAGFFAVVFAMNAALIFMAYDSFDGLAEENYYQKSFFYDAKRSAAKRLGWSVELDFKTSLASNKDLPVMLHVLDKDGARLDGASVVATVRRLTTDDFDTRYDFIGSEAGYNGTLRLPGAGLWEIFVEADKDGSKVEKRFEVRL